ncbi:hypothetical protein HK102_013899, partial [Quaeritorhiza haematococci]
MEPPPAAPTSALLESQRSENVINPPTVSINPSSSSSFAIPMPMPSELELTPAAMNPSSEVPGPPSSGHDPEDEDDDVPLPISSKASSNHNLIRKDSHGHGVHGEEEDRFETSSYYSGTPLSYQSPKSMPMDSSGRFSLSQDTASLRQFSPLRRGPPSKGVLSNLIRLHGLTNGGSQSPLHQFPPVVSTPTKTPSIKGSVILKSSAMSSRVMSRTSEHFDDTPMRSASMTRSPPSSSQQQPQPRQPPTPSQSNSNSGAFFPLSLNILPFRFGATRFRRLQETESYQMQSPGISPVRLVGMMGKEEREGTVAESDFMSVRLLAPENSSNLLQLGGLAEEDVQSPQEAAVTIAITIEEILKRQDFIIRMAKELFRYGCPTHRLDINMTEVASGLGVEAYFAVLPPLILISFGDPDCHTSETHIIKTAYGYNLAKLALVDELADNVAYGKIKDMDVAIKTLNEIRDRPPCYSPYLLIVCHALQSGLASAMLFGGGWIDAALSLCMGSIVGVFVQIVAVRYEGLNNIIEVLAALFVSFVARALNLFIPCMSFWAVVLPSIIWFLPGLMMTMATMELATRNIVAGTARMFYAFLVSMLLGFGLTIGTRLMIWNTRDVAAKSCSPVPQYFIFLLFLPLTSCMFMLMQASPRQLPIMISITAVGYGVSFFARQLLNPDSASVIAAFVVGLLSNLYARMTRQMAIVPIVGGIMLQVPGSIGVRGASSTFKTRIFGDGTQFGFDMIIIALSIIVGLFAATLLVFPRRPPPK